MKKYLIAVLVLSLLMSVFVFANVSSAALSSGKAIIPPIASSNNGTSSYAYSTLSFANITDDPITVKITLYNTDGSIFKDDGSGSTGEIISVYSTALNYSDNLSEDATLTCILNGHTQAGIHILSTTTFSGYGIIEWSQNCSQLKAMIAQAYFFNDINGKVSRAAIPINGGMPF